MPDMTITNTTTNEYSFGPYVLAGTIGATVTIDTTTNASLYLTHDEFTDIVNSLYVHGYITVANPPTPFPRVTGVPEILHGDGSPEGIVFAHQGSSFMRRDNSGSSNALYAKTTGPSLNTGWQAFAGSAAPAPATSLPASPSNGQQAILVDSTSAPTYAWSFQWSSAASAWLFVGGSSALAQVATLENTSTATYVALTTAGPSITLPRPGNYVVEVGCTTHAGSSSAVYESFMSYDIGATGAVDANAFHTFVFGGASLPGSGGSRPVLQTGLTAITLTAKYRCSAATPVINFQNRWMRVTPVSVT